MRVRMVTFAFLFSVTLIGFFSIGTVRALDFADWSGTWFKVTVSETGKAGPVVPVGGDIGGNNEKASTNYLIMQNWDYTQNPTAFNVGYCTFDGSKWSIQVSSTWPILGGEPKGFLTLFQFEYAQSQNVLQEYWIPLHVKGTEAEETVGDITSGSFKHLGGIFLEKIGTPIVTQRGTGAVNFSGTLIRRNKVLEVVPEGCRITTAP